LVKPFVRSIGDLTKRTRTNALNAIKSWYKDNEAAFPTAASIRIKGNPNLPKVKAILKVDKLRVIIGGGSPLEKSMFITGFQAFLGREEFEHVNNNCAGQIREQLEPYNLGEPGFDEDAIPADIVVRLDLPGRKLDPEDQLPFYSFFYKDSVIALHQCLVHKKRKLAAANAVWLNNLGNPVSGQGYSDAFRARVRSLGWIPDARGQGRRARYGYNVHEMRDVPRGRLQLAVKPLGFDEKVAEFCFGHVRKIDSNMYNKFYETEPDYVVGQARLVAPLLNILSVHDPAAAFEEQGRIKQLEVALNEQRERTEALGKAHEALKTELQKYKARLDGFVELARGLFDSKGK
jgi:hypothetical protein